MSVNQTTKPELNDTESGYLRSSHIVGYVLLVVGFGILLYLQNRLKFYTWDDSFITYRHALNMAHGHGLVYNPAEKVDGITNYFLAWLLGNAIKIGIDPLPLSKWIGIVSAWIVLFWTWQYARIKLNLHPVIAGLTVIMLSTSGMFAVESTGGLETLIFTLFVFWILWEISCKKAQDISDLSLLKAGLASGLAMLTRPDAAFFILAAMFLLIDIANLKASARRIALLLIPCLILYLPYFISHWSFYGYPFPNSFYAKKVASISLIARGFNRFITNFIDSGMYIFLMMLIPCFYHKAVNPILREKKINRLTLILITFFAARIIFIIISGGSWMGWGRFLVPVLPVYFLIIAACLNFLFFIPVSHNVKFNKATRFAGLCLAVIFACFNLLVAKQEILREAYPSLHLDRIHIPLGKALRDILTDDESISFGDAGALPYYGNLVNIDPAGLCDKHIAHMKGEFNVKTDPGYIIGRRPSVIILNSINPFPEFNPQSPIDKAIVSYPGFLNEYKFILAFEAWSNYNLWIFARNDKADFIKSGLMNHPELAKMFDGK
jgi:arabinofuranosyltransferase